MKPIRQSIVVLVGLALAASARAQVPGAADLTARPAGVSPGAVERFLPAAACPTFSWTTVADAHGYELVVYRLDDESTQPSLEALLPAGASSWTPAADRCLAAGERYGWSVRAVTATDRVRGEWSEALLFEVVVAPADLAAALDVLRHHLGPDALAAALAAAESRTAAGPEGSASAGDPARLPPTQNDSDAAEQGGGAPLIAVRGEVPDVVGETYGVEGVSHSPDGGGVRAENSNSSGGDLVLAGAPVAELTESAFSRDSGSNLTFNFTNPGAGTMTLQQDGVAVATSATVFPTVLANDGAGSTLDADLLDGLDSAAFLPGGTDDWVNETGDAMTGALIIDVAAGTALTTAAGDAIDLGGNLLKSGVLFLHDNGTNNTGLGISALSANTTGTNNTAVGEQALAANTTGYGNTALGNVALQANTTGLRNIAVGPESMAANTIGHRNVAVGYRTLRTNTEGHRNTALGHASLYSNTTGVRNTGVGALALFYNTTGHRNTAVGNYALNENTTGFRNTAVGFGALLYNATGASNTAVGNYSLAYTTTGNSNAALGNRTLYANTEGNDNAAVGRAALTSNLTGNDNTAVGREALASNTSGGGNIALGRRAGFNSSGNDNIALGNEGVAGENGVIRIGTAGTHGIAYLAGVTGVSPSGGGNLPVVISATGQLGTASGGGSGIDADLLDGIDSTGFMPAGTDLWVDSAGDAMTGDLSLGGNMVLAVGDVQLNAASTVTKGGARFLWDDASLRDFSAGRFALVNNSTGEQNTAVGTQAMLYNTTGFDNTAVGYRALHENTDANHNTGVGSRALEQNTTGIYNTAVGGRALQANTIGTQNTAVGDEALTNNSTGANNTTVGQAAMLSNTTGNDNVAVGLRALYSNSTGISNIAIGRDAGFNLTGNHNVAIAHVGVAGEDGVIRIGTPGNQNIAYLAGVHSVTPSGATHLPVVVDANGQLGTTDLVLLTPRAAAPTCGSGTVYYDSDDETFCFCEAGSFTPLDGVGACT